MSIYYIVAIIVIVLSVAASYRTKKIKLGVVPEAKGFGARDEKVTIIFANGTSRETTFGEIEAKVKEINGEQFWVEKKWDVVIGAVYCAIGLASTALVYYLQKSTSP